MNAGQIIGKEVMDVHGDKVGHIADFEVNFPQWTINRVSVKIGMTKKVTIDVDSIDRLGKQIILKISKTELGKPS